MYRRILIAIDGSESAQLALDEGVKLAQAMDATVTAVCVVPHAAQLTDVGPVFADEQQPYSTAIIETATAALHDAEERFKQANVRGVARAIDAWGEDIAAVLRRAADESEADIVVMGTHGRRGWKRMMLGSVAETFVRTTDLPVLLVRHDADAEPIPEGL